MADPLSDDLRERVCQMVAEGLSGRQAAKLFKVSPSSVSRWRRRLRTPAACHLTPWAVIAAPSGSKRTPTFCSAACVQSLTQRWRNTRSSLR